MTLDEFLKHDDLKKWRYIIDIVKEDDVEALQILIDERRLAEDEQKEKQMTKIDKKAKQEIAEGKIKIKQEKQTDGSCDKTSSEESSTSNSQKTSCRKKLPKEFFVYTYVGNEKKKLKLVEMDTTQSGEASSQDLSDLD